MQKQLDRLLWRRYRGRLLALAGISVLVGLVNALIDVSAWSIQIQGVMFNQYIKDWTVYQPTIQRSATEFHHFASLSLYSYWLVFIFWLGGLVVMWQDLKEHFNQFLFASGYKRTSVYWAKLRVSLTALLGIAIVTMVVQDLVYWVNVPHGMQVNLAWPGLLTTWAVGLAMSVGLFAVSWFAALIIGQSGPLVVTICGFTLSLIRGANVIRSWTTSWTAAQRDWLVVGVWLVAALFLFVWGAVLYRHLSLEHDGEYLLFPALRLPVYLVFIVYLTGLFALNGSGWEPSLYTFLITMFFGYWWLWRPNVSQRWRQWRQRG